MQARITEAQKDDQPAPHAGARGQSAPTRKVADDVMLSQLANEGWGEHVTHQKEG